MTYWREHDLIQRPTSYNVGKVVEEYLSYRMSLLARYPYVFKKI